MNLFKRLLIILFLCSLPCYGQNSPALSIITVYPGNAIYSAFGHSAFRIVDEKQHLDRLYNFGTFNFDAPGFISNFVKGQLNYYLGTENFRQAFQFYSMYENRTIVEQTLNLTPSEVNTVNNFLLENAKPENRYYQYDFIKDNCSSRIATVLKSSLEDKIIFDETTAKQIGTKSYRNYIRSYLGDSPWFDLGIQLALGRIIDRHVSESDSFFLPDMVKNMMDHSYLSDGRPAVSSTRVLYKSDTQQKTQTSILNPPFILFSFLLIFEVILLYIKRKTPKIKKFLFFYEYTAVLVNFLFGLLIFYLWFLSDHTATKENLNILWCSPLNIIFLITFFLKNKTILQLFSRFQLIMGLIFFASMVTGIQKGCPAMIPALFFYMTVFLHSGTERHSFTTAKLPESASAS